MYSAASLSALSLLAYLWQERSSWGNSFMAIVIPSSEAILFTWPRILLGIVKENHPS